MKDETGTAGPSQPAPCRRRRKADYRMKVIRNIEFRAAVHLGLDAPRIVAVDGRPARPEWIDVLTAALRGHGFTEAEMEELIDTEYVLADRQGRYAAVETALLADVDDVTQARRRADLIAKAHGQPAVAAVLCAGYTQEAQEASHRQDVILLHLRENRN